MQSQHVSVLFIFCICLNHRRYILEIATVLLDARSPQIIHLRKVLAHIIWLVNISHSQAVIYKVLENLPYSQPISPSLKCLVLLILFTFHLGSHLLIFASQRCLIAAINHHSALNRNLVQPHTKWLFQKVFTDLMNLYRADVIFQALIDSRQPFLVLRLY